jgi:hypothetical protein
MASVQYVVFRQGADIHFFWPHYFAAWIALGVALGVDSASGAFESRLGGRALALAAAVAGLALALVARDGVMALAYARRTGGRFDEKGVLIDSDGLETAVLRALRAELPADAPVDLHEGMHATWAQVWALGGRVVGLGRPVPRGPAPVAYVADARALPDEQLAELVRRFRVRAYGPVLVADLAGPVGVSAFRVREREPSWLEWAFVSATEPVRSFEANALLTWEARLHLSAADDPPPRELVAAADLADEAVLRVAHNALLQEGRDAEAHDAEARLVERYARATARFDDGTELLGARFDDGARPVLRLLFRAAPAPRDLTLRVRSRVLGRAFLSVTMPDPGVREVGPAPYPPTRRWRAGFLYEHAIPLVQRPGREVFELEVVPRGARAPMGYTGSLPAGANRGAARVLELP